MAQAAQLRLAEQPVVAVPPEPGPARGSGPGNDPSGAGETLVGNSPAIRLAPVAFAGPGARAVDAAHGGRRDPVRDRHRGPQHPIRLHFRIQLLHGALLRGVGIYRRICVPCLPEAADNGAQPAVAVAALGVRHVGGRHGARTARPRRAGSTPPRSPDPEPARRAGRCGRRQFAGRGADRWTNPGRVHSQCGAVAAPRPQLRQGAQRLSDQPHRFCGGHRRGLRRRTVAPALVGRPRTGDIGPRRTRRDATPHRGTAHRLRRRVVDYTDLVRYPAFRSGRRGRDPPPGFSGRVLTGTLRCLQPRDLAKQPDPEPRLAVGVSGQRCRPLVGSWVSGSDYRSRASGCALHQMGVRYRVPGDLMRALGQLASRLYGDRLFHLVVVLAALALGAYTISVLGVRNLFNPTVWWQSIAVWFVVAVIGHDLILFPLYSLADRLLSAPRRAPVGHRLAVATNPSTRIPLTNYLRIPTLAAALLLMMFLPGIIEQGAPTYRAATGLTQTPYLSRWLLLTAAFYDASTVCYAIRTQLRQRRSGEPARRQRHPEASNMPSCN